MNPMLLASSYTGDGNYFNNQDDNNQSSQLKQESKGVKRMSVNNNYSNKNYYKKKKVKNSDENKNISDETSVIKSLQTENSQLKLKLDCQEMLKEETEQSFTKTIEENSKEIITLNKKLLTKEALLLTD